MSTNSLGKTPIYRTPPPIKNQGKVALRKVALRKNDFDSKIWTLGNDVFVDKAIRCPCRTKSNNQAKSSCKNCGGSGFVFINRYRSRLIMQSMNIGTKFKEWSEESLGMVKITARNEDELAFMDRITLLDGLNIHNETVHTFILDNAVKGRLDYPPIEIEEINIFIDSNTLLRKLIYNTDYTILGDIITLSDEFLSWSSGITISIRYKYNPMFHILDLPRGTIQSDNLAGNSQKLPIHAIGRRSHYVVDQQNFDKTFLLDNSYEVPCQNKANVIIQENIVC